MSIPGRFYLLPLPGGKDTGRFSPGGTASDCEATRKLRKRCRPRLELPDVQPRSGSGFQLLVQGDGLPLKRLAQLTRLVRPPHLEASYLRGLLFRETERVPLLQNPG